MKIAMIGLGDIAQKAYLPVLAQLPDVELVLCTRNPKILGTLATRYRVRATCTDYRDVLQHGVDAVMIHAATDVHSTLATFSSPKVFQPLLINRWPRAHKSVKTCMS